MCTNNKEWSGQCIYHLFSTYRNNVVEVEQDPNKGEEQVHVYFVSDDGTVKVVSPQEDGCSLRLMAELL
jgi:transcription initiation factor IIF auxiliary subunit